MDIIQQKLVWLLGSGAGLLLLFKLKLSSIGTRKSVLNRLRAGALLILLGALAGISFRMGLTGSLFPESGAAFFLETIIGYTLGWAFIIWGLLGWSQGFFDRRGKPLSKVAFMSISEKITKSLMNSRGSDQLMESVADELLDFLGCQAITLHRLQESRRLKLSFHRGLVESSIRLVENPEGENNQYISAIVTGRVVVSNKDRLKCDVIHPETRKGPVLSSMTIPITSNGDVLGVLSIYKTEYNIFSDGNLEIMKTVSSGLATIMKRETTDTNRRLENRNKEMLDLAIRPFEEDQPLISAMIKSGKLIHSYLPFDLIRLYLHGNGNPKTFDFNLPTGGVVEIKEGFFPEHEFPGLYADISSGEIGFEDISTHVMEEKRYLFPIGDGTRPLAHLEIELKATTIKQTYIHQLGKALGEKIADHIERENTVRSRHRMDEWLGVLRYYQEKALSSNNLLKLLKELVSTTVDITPVTFCRIMFADPGFTYLKTAAVAQARDLCWPNRYNIDIPLSVARVCREVLHNGAKISFDQTNQALRVSREEAVRLLPSGVKHGVIIPLAIKGKQVGVMIAGEFRRVERVSLNAGSSILLDAVAGLISLVLSLYKEQRTIKEAKEGVKKLYLHKKGMGKTDVVTATKLNIKSRINGPLAGIIASCEYLKSDLPNGSVDFHRCLDIIEHSATQIQCITAGFNSEDEVSGSALLNESN